ASNWVMGDVLRLVKERKLDDALMITEWPVAAAHLGELIALTDEGAISAKIDSVLAAHPDKVADFRAGKDKLLGFFVGQVMKATGGKANPGLVNRLQIGR